MNPYETKLVALCLIISVFCGSFIVYQKVWGAVPNSTAVDTTQQYTNGTSIVRADYIVCDGDYFWEYNGTLYNVTAAISSLVGVNATNEWGLVYGTTGDWFNYTVLSGAVPVYINVHMHPSNETVSGIKLIPQVYDKNANAWQLALYWINGTQYTKGDVLVMYYAHIDWDNPTGETYITANGQEPV